MRRPQHGLLGIQPSGGSALADIGELASAGQWQRLLVCVAYATAAGVEQLVDELVANWANFVSARKTFLVGLDFGLTEPGAIRLLASLPNARCHVYEAEETLRLRLRPEPRFHPKLFAFLDAARVSSSQEAAVLVGSTNLSASGLNTNLEAYAYLWISRADSENFERLAQVEALASRQTLASDSLLARYEAIRPTQPAERATPRRYSILRVLEPRHFRAIQTAKCLWTQTFKIVPNLGPDRPGNQVDLTRGARAFFGSTVPLNAPVNTPLGTIVVNAGAGREECGMRFGHNGMDKVNLPHPGGRNPDAYDNTYLLWEKLDDGTFRLHVREEPGRWRDRAGREGLLFTYGNSPREWGCFSGPV